MGRRCPYRDFVSGNRCGTRAVCRNLAEGSDDMSGMHWNRLVGDGTRDFRKANALQAL